MQASIDVAVASDGVIADSTVKRFVDLSTTGSPTAQQISERLRAHGIEMLDCPVSGGVHGAGGGTLAMMVSGPRPAFDAVRGILETLGRPIFVSEKPGAAQTMKLVNNMMAATALAATAVKDVRLYLDEARALGLPTHIADAVAALWENTLAAEGPDSDFTSVVKPIEVSAGVIVKGGSGA